LLFFISLLKLILFINFVSYLDISYMIYDFTLINYM
jgi:hypothetical protein